MTRVLVCGGRDYDDADKAFSALDAFHRRKPITLVIEGGARGADRLGRLWAQARGVPWRTFPADWKRLGKAAGHIRNQQMLDEGHPEFVVAFPGGRGTADMIGRAERIGLRVWQLAVGRTLWLRAKVSPTPPDPERPDPWV